jgi:predicted helicase
MTAMAFDEVFDRLYFSATSEHDKGSKFEELLESYLQTEPKYADQFSKVWRWQHWPGRAGRVDTGIDLVAEDRYTGELVAIQAKFYDPERKLEKHHIDSFFTELGKEPFARGMIVSSTDRWSSHAEAALAGQTKEVQRIRLRDFAESTIDWSVFDLDRPHELIAKPGKQPRKYQREAIDDVIDGFTTHDRGKLIMACGTGKTFTALSLVEQYVPAGGSVLFLVPSIALLQQTLNEWTAQANVNLRPFAVCSDTSVGRKQSEDVSVHDLGFPATTDPNKLAARFNISTGDESISVVFSTYQSIDVIHQAQQLGAQRGEAGLPGMGAFEKGLPAFDLIICDEAHRTTGISQPGADDSAFVRVHNDEFIHANKRLYMTATPRIYVEDSKTKAAQDGVAVYSMDDESTYGPEFHHLGFGRAVELGHLSDYKVLILAVDEASVATSFQRLLSEDGDLNLDDVARIVGCWNGLSKRGVHGQRLAINDDSPMNRAVAFARNIKESKALADQFEKIGRELLVNRSDDQSKLRMEAEHVDGTFNVLERSKRLEWLQEEAGANTCRILTNAKCLTEGVDVPSLDGVLFLNPRNSQVDVVQAVGRVMRKAPGKEYGYIVLPIAVPADQDPETALNDNKKYKVVWDVLQALRAHDDRFEAMINKIDLDKGANKTVDVIGVGTGNEDADSDRSSGQDSAEALFSMVNAAAWENAIFARMVKKVGDRRYWEDWAADVKDIADRQTARLLSIINDPDNTVVEDRFSEFVSALRANLNDGITDTDAVDMLVQHMITKPVFDALFDDYDFTAHNPVSKVMDTMLAVLGEYNLNTETGKLDEFYRSVRIRAEGIESAQGKQKIITELYERFFKLAFPKTAESLGIVYTPIEVVDFILRSVNDVLKEHFGTTISGEGVHVLDPFTGTGTFITRLLQSGLIDPSDLARKYTSELHANEILLMAYYIAAINIEATFHGLQREAAVESGTDPDQVGYKPFEGIVLTDTFQMTENGDTLDEAMFIGNNDRVIAQNGLDIRVILGNPPYSVGQTSGNDNNANQKYPTLDESIRSTYAAQSSATLKNSLYDSYIRAIRWASNRVLDSDNGGVVCYVSNGGYIDGNTADGLRKTLTNEFHDVYIYNLRGNARTAGELRRKEKDNVFGEGGRTTIAVMVLVKRPGPVEQCLLHYKDIGDYLDRATKLATLEENSLASLDWVEVVPNQYGDWINQRDPNYENYPLIADRRDQTGRTIFAQSSNGLATSRDAWVYNYSEEKVSSNAECMIDFYNREIDRWEEAKRPANVDIFVDGDPTKISWSSSLKNRFRAGKKIDPTDTGVRPSTYRPFNKQHLAANVSVLERPALIQRAFPTPDTTNIGFYNVGAGSAVPFSVLMLDAIPDLHVTGAGSGGQFFARYSYSHPAEDTLLTTPTLRDNITDWALSEYRKTYGDVSKDDIFFYVYGLLHSAEYRTTYESELKKTLPRIPQVKGRESFDAFVKAGRELSSLHIGYETVDPYPLTETFATVAPEGEFDRYAVTKMKYGGKSGAWDKTVIKYNPYITIEGIPEEAQRYVLGARSGLDWILERYQVKTHKPSGIVNDPNDWSREHGQPRFIIDLIGKITTVSLETMRIVDALPELHSD